MAFNEQEQAIIKYGLANGKSRADVEQALTNYRTGVTPTKESAPAEKKPSYTEKVIDNVSTDMANRADRVGAILNRKDTGTLEKGVQVFGQGAGMAANVLEQTVAKIPGVDKVAGAIGAGINWLATSKYSPIKMIGDIIGNSKALQEATKLYDTDPNFKDTVDGVANAVRLGGDVSAAMDAANFGKNVTDKLVKNVKDSGVIPDTINTVKDTTGRVVDATKNVAGKVLDNKDSKLLSIFTGENQSVVDAALKNPEAADLGIKGGDTALRTAVQTGAESSIKAKTAFIKGQSDAVAKIVGDSTAKVSRQKVLYQFVDDLKANGVDFKNGKANFTTSKINTNPGEVSKITSAYTAIKNWKDWSVKGVHELKQIIGGYTKFATEAGGSSKSPFLGKFYKFVNDTIKETLPADKAKAYDVLNTKFGENIGLYDDMVDAFNSGDPFSKLSQIFGSNKDSLRQIVDFYEKTTGNQIAPVIAGRTLAESRPAAFGFLNPRQWIDFFIDPQTQASIVTGYGKIKK